MTDTRYTRALADEICRRISEGESLRAICREAGMPSDGTVRGWAREDRDGFGTCYRQARDLQLDFWADEILDIADEANADPRDRQVRIDTRKWLMSKLAPRRYGDRLLHAGDPELPVQHLYDFDLDAAVAKMTPQQLDALEAFTRATLAAQESR